MPQARLPLTSPIASRQPSTDRDSLTRNALFEDKTLVKRPGFNVLASTPALPTGTGQGIASWNGYIIAANSNSIYAIAGGISSNLGNIIGTSVPLSFTQTAADAHLVFHNGSNIYDITKAGMVVTQPISGGEVVSVRVDDGGYGYTTPPTITFSPPAAGVTATGHAVLFNGAISYIVIDNPGSGYTASPTITIGAPTGSFTTATGYLTYTSSYVASVVITNGGGPYIVNPDITWVYSVGSGVVSGYANITNNTVSSVSITNNGDGIFAPSSITFSAPTSRQAKATAVMSNTISGPFAYGIEYLDGYVFIMTTTGRVYASDYENPTIWNALNYISAESDPDEGIALVRHLNYLVGFGQWSTDFFYNAGNSVGSPLSVNKQAKLEIGCANGASVAKADQTVLWVSNSLTQGRCVYLMEGLSPRKVSNRYIDKYLNRDTMKNVRSYCLRIAGHAMYVLTLIDSDITFVYDLDEQVWYQWTSQTGGVESYFKFIYYTGHVEYDPNIYLQHETDGHVYIMSADAYKDGVEDIWFRSITDLLDSGTHKRKFYKSVEVIGDKIDGNLSIRHSNDDYITWSSYRAVNLKLKRPILYQLGDSRRRAFELFSSANIPIRLEALEISFDIGEQGGGQEG